MAAEYQRWIKVANDLGLGGDELRTFVKDRQEEAKAERTKVEEAEKETRKLEAEREARKLETEREARKLETEREAKKIENEREERKLETEREARKLETEREARKLEADTRKLEADTRKLEAERETKKLEQAERKFLAELEAKRISEEQESRRILAEQESRRILAEQESKRLETESLERVKLRELEIRLTIEKGNAERQNFLGQGDVRTEHRGTIRDVQMPLYDQSEDLDIYLNRFELTCSALKISKDLWVLALIKSLKGQALEVHERMRAEDAQDYDKLKIELLKRFRLTEGGYRKKFKGAVREKDETTVQFGDRLTRYLEKWLQMSGFKETYAGLKELIIRDQFFCKCDDETRCFIKQKGKLDLEDTLTQAQYFLESKDSVEREWLPGQRKDKGSFKDYKGVDRNNAMKPKEKPNEQKETRSFQPKGTYQNAWLMRNQNSDPNKTQPRRGCYICNSSEHKAYECKQRNGGKTVYTQAMRHISEERSEKKEEDDEMVEMSALEAGYSNAETKENDDSYADFIDIVKVNGKEIQALYDTGATKPALRRELVKKDQYTDKSVLCTFPNGVKERYPIAKVEVDGEHYKGMVEVMVMPNLLKDMILTPQQYIRPVKTKEVSTQDSSTNTVAEEKPETDDVEAADDSCSEDEEDEVPEVNVATYELRSKSKETRTRGVKPLKWPVLTEWNVTPAEVLKTQMEDKTLAKYWKMAREVASEPDGEKGRIQFEIKKGMLYRKHREILKDDVTMQLMVPEKLRSRVLHAAHESLMSAHQGIKKTQDKISAVFYWPSMLNDVKAHVINCDLCSDGLVKQGLTKAPLGHLPLVGEPFRSISVDIAGPIEPRSASGYRYILSIVDMATRFPEAIPLKPITAEEVAEELFKFYCRMGIPERIHTDRGSQFTSDLMSKVNRMLPIKHTFSSPYHAMGNGAVERLNGTIKMTLRKLIKEQPKEWDRFLVP